ncbi:argininosuccinate lyase [Candidatus Gottesmanbacteria bacterium CG11_big_fil_rev_8_21_14_0_20_37_11]|uniref:Argininosuccinate lyase n=3 Tax=Candidatus Gottesmaniibacteriota TaxID=1752720 RepID=A0A2M7RQX0_9BACT|nr:MAG: argininosuccinate lyase [Candidatus Gottesmanbacteria bacterium CG1_02_37_22]PIP32561.1 MAG: argininosuccinate lyase [Candidatus Gottesmanbacteria bacterium CG23_combo_of_CG06-09_8_20_14_all_37_19]PIR08243.1 MAG: argininosuccinate lyase [Candidatus Gottesmanbacteria bacterium CG11_big_fil_rev_8_21_14_0_20_37_11]PIZ02696.1 MAG: argininosuccinate lyase [Candidatus Gottesmanbacteria bacterium CG_4_10_14_0_8_um_filter_37_24]
MKTNEFIVSKTQQALDLNLVPYDLWATKVHVLMLVKQNIIEKSKARNILSALFEIGNEFKQGKFSIDPNKGLHLTIEAKVIEKIGDDGYFMHTARSRNDQVMTCEMLYLKEKALKMMKQLLDTQETLTAKATGHIETIMPGYTHMQPAKPTTFGQWCLAYNDMFIKCFENLEYIFDKYDLCPLGAAESYGTSWNVDRAYTARLLGFSKVWEIPQEAISSRGFPQLAYLGVLKDIAIVISKIACDLLLFTTFEFGYISLSDMTAQQMGSVTGSSIMPQKKNPDVLELLRSISSRVIGYESIVANLLSGLPMGYNRDTREVKEYIELGFTKVEQALESFTGVLQTIQVNKDRMYQSVVKNYSLSTDLADYLSQKKGPPYRKVYKLVGSIVKDKIVNKKTLSHLTAKELTEESGKIDMYFNLTDGELKTVLNPLDAVMKRKHIGGASAPVMKKIVEERKKIFISYSNWIESTWVKINSAKEKTDETINNI